MATVEEIEENKKNRIQKSSFMIEDILSTQAKALSGTRSYSTFRGLL